MRVLISGGSGFIGTNLESFYRERGEEVLAVDSVPPRDPSRRGFGRQIDLLDREAIATVFDEFRPSHFFHLGARTDLHGESQRDYAANIGGLENVIEAARRAPSLQRVIFASSRMVCRIDHRPSRDDEYSPPNAYGESKMIGEGIVRESGLEVPWTIVRPTSIWGPWFDVPYKSFFLSIARGRYVHIRGHSVEKSFGYVGNTVHQLDRLVEAPAVSVAGKTLYLGDYPPIDTYDMAERIRAEIGAPRIRTLPMVPLKVAAAVGDGARRLGWAEPPLTSFRLANLVSEMVYDLEPLETVVGELPHSLDQGIAATVRWMREAGEI
jgi:nucleoside-diphosphate-sugar epimerase